MSKRGLRASIAASCGRSRRAIPVLVSKDLTAEFLPGTGRVSAAVASLSGIDAAGLLQSLADYPFECSEQLVSRTMPLLYVGKLADPKALAFDTGIADRVNRAIAILLARQDSSGAFGLWSSDNASDEWLNAFVTDFLTRAREEGYDVPQQAFGQALERLRNFVANTSDVEAGQSAGLAYAVYVLARNGKPVMEDLRYLADARLSGLHDAAGAGADRRGAGLARRSWSGGESLRGGERQPRSSERQG